MTLLARRLAGPRPSPQVVQHAVRRARPGCRRAGALLEHAPPCALSRLPTPQLCRHPDLAALSALNGLKTKFGDRLTFVLGDVEDIARCALRRAHAVDGSLAMGQPRARGSNARLRSLRAAVTEGMGAVFHVAALLLQW